MSQIGYGHGSEWHVLRWLGYHRAELGAEVERAIKKTLPNASEQPREIEWLDLEWNNKSYHLHWKVEWEGIKFIARSVQPNDIKAAVAQAWKEFWPSSGTAQCWDAVGVRQGDDGQEWLLVEAKAHRRELKGSGCGAGPDSRRKIEHAFVQTQKALGIYSATDDAVNTKLMAEWLGSFYQFANRMAALYFFNVYLPQQHYRAHLENAL